MPGCLLKALRVRIASFPTARVSTSLDTMTALTRALPGTGLSAIHRGAARWDDYATLFVWYYLNFFVVIFFNAALVGCANIRLSGGDPTVGDGLRIAAARIHRILAWAFIATTVGVLLQSLRNRRSLFGGLLGGALGLGWTLITYLIVPVIVVEDLNITNSISRSTELFRKNWGEQVAGDFGFGLPH